MRRFAALATLWGSENRPKVRCEELHGLTICDACSKQLNKLELCNSSVHRASEETAVMAATTLVGPCIGDVL